MANNTDGKKIELSRYIMDDTNDYQHLLCPICTDVFDSPVVLTCCGQTLCEDCVLRSLQDRPSCPMCCEEEIGIYTKIIVLNDQIEAMKVKCMNNKNPEEHCECSWTGKFSDWTKHNKNECNISRLTCPIDGCGFKGTCKEMLDHNINSTVQHVNLLVEAKVGAVVADKVTLLEEKHNKDINSIKRKHLEDMNKISSHLNDEILELNNKIEAIEKKQEVSSNKHKGTPQLTRINSNFASNANKKRKVSSNNNKSVGTAMRNTRANDTLRSKIIPELKVHDRIKIWWPKMKKWYSATIVEITSQATNDQPYTIWYDDERQPGTIDLTNEKYGKLNRFSVDEKVDWMKPPHSTRLQAKVVSVNPHDTYDLRTVFTEYVVKDVNAEQIVQPYGTVVIAEA